MTDPDAGPTDSAAVRPAAPSDAADIAAVHVASWRAAYVGIVPQAILDRLSVERRQAFWTGRLEDPDETRTFVAVADGRVVGIAGTARPTDPEYSPGTAELETIYLLPEVWNRGLGRQLMDHAMDDLVARGFSTAILWVLTDNVRGRRFYDAAGWRPDGRAQMLDFSGTSIEEIRYRLDLAGRAR
jgi:GNAT superfamily N-acetyltransferase